MNAVNAVNGVMRHLAWLLLSISLLFNVFFAAGYFQARREAGLTGSGDAVLRRVADELRLTEAQAEALTDLRRGIEEEVAHLNEGLALADQQLLDELRSTPPDEGRIGETMMRRDELQQRRHRIMSERFREFVQMLTPEQRERLAQRMRGSPMHGMGRRLMMLRRFDRDRDGQLNPDERAEACEQFNRHEKTREEMWREMLRRFDENGDGELDSDERRRMEQWRHEARDRRREAAPGDSKRGDAPGARSHERRHGSGA